MSLPIEFVETLARALDEDDYPVAASTMSTTVEYTIGDEVLAGPEAVVANYRTSSEMAHRLFDDVGYGHEVQVTDDPNSFRVSYSDVLTVGGESLIHAAEQLVTVSPGEGVVRIVNIELSGETERVDRFMERHGIARDR